MILITTAPVITMHTPGECVFKIGRGSGGGELEVFGIDYDSGGAVGERLRVWPDRRIIGSRWRGWGLRLVLQHVKIN